MIDSPALANGLRIGILGGSFNPSHAGHVEITEAARRACGLDRVWWFVSPQNPLKNAGDYLPFDERMRRAEAITEGRPWLRVSDFEARINTRFTADTLGEVVRRYPASKFVWIMGADNLAGFHRWQEWRQIARTMPIAVVSRPGYGLGALTSITARTFARNRILSADARGLPAQTAPAWVFLPMVHNPLSATALRSGKPSAPAVSR